MSKRVTITPLGRAVSVRWQPSNKTIGFELSAAQTLKLAVALVQYVAKGYGTVLWADARGDRKAYVTAVK
jgi:hypothetical protein